GNGAYIHTPPLPNATNDGRAIAEVLRGLDFEVLEGIDLDRRAMEEHIQQFARQLRGATVGMFFYAGHGLQVRNDNYLVPIDAKLEDEADLAFEAVTLDVVMTQMEREPRTSLVFLDACRDNPLARSLARTMGATRSASVGRGLARIESGLGTLIVYATEPDNVALDGVGINSPFTAALLENIEAPGVEVRHMMDRVRLQVLDATNNQQLPWASSSLTGQFYFKPAAPAPGPAAADAVALPPVPEAPPLRTGAAEIRLWDATQSIETPEQRIAALNVYRETYPDGQFVRMAELQIAALTAQPQAPARADIPAERSAPENHTDVAVAPPVTPPPAVDQAAGERAMRLTRDDWRDVQYALTLLGYDTGGIDGLIGPRSRRAITAFQSDRGLPQTGYLDGDQLVTLVDAAVAARPLEGNSCEWAYDGECDDARFVGNDTSVCASGTDAADCAGLPLRSTQSTALGNSCEFAFDGDCDEPSRGTGLCATGTDTADCSVRNPGPNSCQFAYDGECDHADVGTGACPPNTDAADCSSQSFAGNKCEWAYDGECDENRYFGNVTNLCPAGTDTADCSGLRLR
ncbi:MAG: caspase family protein, partial [Alphaproteobacteria bacterium]